MWVKQETDLMIKARCLRWTNCQVEYVKRSTYRMGLKTKRLNVPCTVSTLFVLVSKSIRIKIVYYTTKIFKRIY